MNRLLKFLVLFNIGGLLYFSIETVYKMAFHGTCSHWSMYLLGGLCFWCIGLINNVFDWEMPLCKQMFYAACLITLLEFITGCIVNLYFGWNVWDYSDIPLNIMGQICVPFFIVWYLLSLLAIVLDDMLRYKLFGERKPYYTV